MKDLLNLLQRITQPKGEDVEHAPGNSSARNQKSASKGPLYASSKPLLDEDELGAFQVIRSATEGQYVVWPKVRLADICSLINPIEDLDVARFLGESPVAFLLCDPDSFSPLAVVRLDDEEPDKQQLKTDEVLHKIGLPVVQLTDEITMAAVQRQITAVLGGVGAIEPVTDKLGSRHDIASGRAISQMSPRRVNALFDAF